MARTPEDDWFPQADTSPSPGEPEQPIEDEWLAGDDPLTRPPPFAPWSVPDRRVLIPIGFGLVFLVALLAAFGVFSSSSPPISAPSVGTATPSIPRATTPAVARTAPGPPTTTLKPGDSGPQVKALQRELASLGYYAGAIDGDYGQATVKAVAAFQRAGHLTPDGVVGRSTLLALGP